MMNENKETRYCKKCGCELMSTNKKKLCENCRRKRNEKIRNGALGIGSTAAAVTIAFLKHGKGGNNKKG